MRRPSGSRVRRACPAPCPHAAELANREFKERFERSLGRETFAECFHFSRLFETLMTYIPDVLNGSLDSPMVVGCLRRLLQPTSHPFLRREGLRLLLMWMKYAFREDTRQLFAACVDLSQFNTDSATRFAQAEFPRGNVGGPLVKASLSLIDQAAEMFEDILDMITFDPDASRVTIQAIYKEFQRGYLAVLYPAVFQEYKLIRHEGCRRTSRAPDD